MDAASPPPSATSESKPRRAKSPRARALKRIVGGLVVLLALALALRTWLHGRHFEGTDDAQVDGDIVRLSAQVTGTVRAVEVVENQWVEAGAPIAELDPADLQVAVSQARAAVAQASANEHNAHSEETRAVALRRAEVIPPAALEARQSAAERATAALRLAKAQLAQAELNLAHAKIVAPARGIVAKKAVSVGDHVAPGQELVAISRVDRVWITANFRETQLRRLRPGQTVQVHVDALGKTFNGTVRSFGGATGAKLSVLPPENAAGNYVKVVQRIQVRIELAPGQQGLEQLRPGMSVEPRVRVG